MPDVASDVIAVIAKQANTEPGKIVRETLLTDLDLNSFDHIELIFALEERFNIEIPFNANDTSASVSFSNAGEVIDAIARLVAEQKGASA